MTDETLLQTRSLTKEFRNSPFGGVLVAIRDNRRGRGRSGTTWSGTRSSPSSSRRD